MNDLISKQAVIDAIERNGCNTQRIFDAVTALSSASQDDVIIGKTYHTGNLTSPHLSLISDEILERISKLERDTRFDYTEISCRNCGGKILQKIDDHILKCPYCGTAYIIGRYQINS